MRMARSVFWKMVESIQEPRWCPSCRHPPGHTWTRTARAVHARLLPRLQLRRASASAGAPPLFQGAAHNIASPSDHHFPQRHINADTPTTITTREQRTKRENTSAFRGTPHLVTEDDCRGQGTAWRRHRPRSAGRHRQGAGLRRAGCLPQTRRRRSDVFGHGRAQPLPPEGAGGFALSRRRR